MDREEFDEITNYLIAEKAITYTDIYLDAVYNSILRRGAGSGYIYNCYINELLKGGITFEELIKNVSAISYVYFNESMSDLKNVTITDNITYITESAFQDTHITSISFESSRLHTISSRCCKNCFELSEINISSSITTINSFAFASCNALEKLTIPANVENIHQWAFRHCRNLKVVEFEDLSDKLDIADTAFESCINLEKIIVHSNYLFDLFSSDDMKTYKAEIIFEP